jgi:hypothetical protein
MKGHEVKGGIRGGKRKGKARWGHVYVTGVNNEKGMFSDSDGRRKRAKINRDAVDVRLTLCSPPYIAFNMNALNADNKIKICINLGPFQRY